MNILVITQIYNYKIGPINEPEQNPQKKKLQETQIKNYFFKYCYEVMHTCIHIDILIVGIFR